MKYKKILIGATTIVGAGAVGSAVAVPVASTNQQSSSTVGPVDPDTPVNPPVDPDTPVNPPVDPDTPVNPPVDPDVPDVPATIASVPSSEVDSFHLTLPYTNLVNDSASLGSAISALFKSDSNFATDFAPSGSQSSYLDGSASYENVLLSYVQNSASFVANGSTFKMLAVPTEGSEWADGSTSPKTIVVSVDINYTAEVPSTNSDTFSYPISLTNDGSQDNNTLLNTALTNLFGNSSDLLTSNFKTYLTGASSYHNVSLSYVANSADFASKTFKAQASPISGTNWGDRTNASKEISVSLSNVSLSEITKDASVSSTNVLYSDKIVGVEDNDALINYLKQNFSTDKLSNFSSSNVVVTLDESSINFDTSWFKLSAVPTQGHAWSDGSTAAKDIIVNYVLVTKYTNVPTMWSINAAVEQKYTYWQQITNGSANFNVLADAAIYDMGMYAYKNFEYVANSAQFVRSSVINNGYATLFKMRVVPSNEYTWEDGSTDAKDIWVNVYICKYSDTAVIIGEQGFKPVMVDPKFQRWISNFTFSTGSFGPGTFADNQAILKERIVADLNNTFDGSDWTFVVSNPMSVHTTGYDYYDVWTYTITFTSKSTGQVINRTGLTFTMSPSNYSALYNGVPLPDLSAIKNASISANTATYSDKIPGVFDNASLLNYLKTNFNGNKLANFTANNVTFTIDESSVDYNGKSFKVSAVPAAGYAWEDGSTAAKVITVSCDYAANISRIPTVWSLDAAIEEKYTYWQQVTSGSADYNAIADATLFDLGMYGYNNIQYVANSAKYVKTLEVYKGLVTVMTMRVIPAQGFTWEDGSVAEKEISVNVYTCVFSDVAVILGQDAFKPVMSDPKFQRWISNFTFSTGSFGPGTFADNQAILKEKIVADLNNTFDGSDWTFVVSSPVSIDFGGYDYFNVWTYTITFTSKSTGQIINRTGLTFVTTPANASLLNS